VDEKRGQKEERCSPLPKNSACFSKIESLHCSYGCAFRLFLEIQGLTRLLISREVILQQSEAWTFDLHTTQAFQFQWRSEQ
jgi:hypothetical protein